VEQRFDVCAPLAVFQFNQKSPAHTKQCGSPVQGKAGSLTPVSNEAAKLLEIPNGVMSMRHFQFPLGDYSA